MTPRVNSRRRRWVRILAAALAAAAILAVPSVREPLLRAAGWALFVNEPVAASRLVGSADTTIISAGCCNPVHQPAESLRVLLIVTFRPEFDPPSIGSLT